jgi:hypothetical protein
MATYRALVSFVFDDSDLEDIAQAIGVDPRRLDVYDTVNAELDSVSLGYSVVEQIFRDGKPTISRLSGGITTEINRHEDL